jgi:hypothetical protein
MAKKLKCPICRQWVIAEIDEKGNIVLFGKDDNYHKCIESSFRYGYCKRCRTREILLPREDLCFDCG